MFIREVKTRIKGQEYTAYRLVEAYRNSEGKPRQRVIMNLGAIDLPRNRWKELAYLLEQRVLGQVTFESITPELERLADDLYARAQFVHVKPEAERESEEKRDLVHADLNSIRFSQIRSLGPELVVQKQWDDLGMKEILEEAGLTERQISVAQALVFGKLIEPGSELSTWRWFNKKTALCEMTPEDISGLGKDSFYEVGDLIYSNKECIERALYARETTLFGLDRRLFLFDLTNTYFEGNGLKNELAQYGKSKEKRSDCPLVSLALMVDSEGFPVYSRILKGNQSEPETLQAVLTYLQSQNAGYTDGRKPVLIMDRGIATKSNVELIKSLGYSYTVIERAPEEKGFVEEYAQLKELLDRDEPPEDEELSKAGWIKAREGLDVYIRREESPEGVRMPVFSLRKEAKELSMDRLKESRMLEDLDRLQKSVRKGNIVVPDKVSERIGRIRQKYSGISAVYDMELIPCEDRKRVQDITWGKRSCGVQRSILAGCYVIETDRRDLTAEEIWRDYVTITRVESAFRDLKSELGLRPVFHQTADRTRAHLFIGVLAYHLLAGIESRLKRQGDPRDWKTIRSVLSTHQRATISLTSKDGELIQIRLSGDPESCHRDIYRLLGVADRLRRRKTVMNQRK